MRLTKLTQSNHREIVLKHVSEVVGRIKTLWGRSRTILGKSIFEDFSTPKNFPGSGNFDSTHHSSPSRLCDKHDACGTEKSSRDHVKTVSEVGGRISFCENQFLKIFDSQKYFLGSGFSKKSREKIGDFDLL